MRNIAEESYLLHLLNPNLSDTKLKTNIGIFTLKPLKDSLLGLCWTKCPKWSACKSLFVSKSLTAIDYQFGNLA